MLNLYRIENVSTRPAERITVNDEERKRQGFELQTTFRWARRDGGQPDVRSVIATDKEGLVARLNYGPGAEISRINKGLRRRANTSQHGFLINPINGQWAKLEEDDTGGEEDPTKARAERIVPWVKDQKNALLFQLSEADANETSIATVQYALKRGIESIFQLEESELLAEPLPDRKDRKGVLFYEATEGGAGVLSQLVHDENALARVAHAALQSMHYDVGAFGQTLPSPDALANVPAADCVAGCYRCLLSYYNQPDHLVIDRRDSTAVETLLRLAASKTSLVAATVALPPTGAAARFRRRSSPITSARCARYRNRGLRRTCRLAIKARCRTKGRCGLRTMVEKGVQTVHWPSDPEPQEQALSTLRQLLN